MQTIQVALGLIRQGDLYHLQLRNYKTTSGGNNRIGCFGGLIEGGENALEAVVRELREETSLRPKPTDFTFIGKVEVESDYRGQTVKVVGHVFQIELPKDASVTTHEGELVSLSQAQLVEKIEAMTTGTAAAFRKFILKG